MNITMSTNLKSDLVMAIRKFIDTTTSHTCALVEWQWILSWINWGLKAFPLLCPALQSSYAKITGKSQAHALIYSNRIVIQDLMWLANLMHDLEGICMLDSIVWDHTSADLVIFCDACPAGLGFYVPTLNVGFCSLLRYPRLPLYPISTSILTLLSSSYYLDIHSQGAEVIQ